MPLFSQDHDALDDRLHDAPAVTADLISEVIGNTPRRLPVRIEHLIQSGAWTDAALALLRLKLPQWQLRRLAYDEGEWYCALSRQRELPEWLDQSVEAHHPDLSLAILSAFAEARRNTAPSSRTSVPAVIHSASPLHEPVCSDNFA
jgi:hypothetical protein